MTKNSMQKKQLQQVAKQLMTEGKGILAADESTSTATKRLEAVGVDSTAETRQAYRDLFLSTPGIEEYLSGVILYDETIRQDNAVGIPFAQLLRQKGIIPGIKVDLGKEPDPNSPDETLTIGLADLEERLEEYKQMGAQFTKWRAVIKIRGEELPTKSNIRMEAKRLAQYAATAQRLGFVPIIEPEVLLDGNHTIERSAQVLEQTLKAVFSELKTVDVDMKALILKTSMALPGDDFGAEAGPEDVARFTSSALHVSVPDKIAGVVFLSGGQDPIEATMNIDKIAEIDHPWPITFSFARAIQQPTLDVWQGKPENVEKAREIFLKRLRLDTLATTGEYDRTMENS